MKKIELRRNIICPIADELSVLDLQVLGQVAAGYPAEAYNYIEERIDMNKYILGIKDDERFANKEGREVYDGKNSKYIECVSAKDKNIIGEGIDIGDLIVIDTQKKPHKDSIVLYFIDDELALKKSIIHNDHIKLLSLDENKKPIRFEGEYLSKIGVVISVVKKFRAHYDDSILVFYINLEYTLKRIIYE